jgi:hypothetical protein
MNESEGISKSHSSFVSDISKPEIKTPERKLSVTPPKHIERQIAAPKPQVDFTNIENKEDREKATQNLLSEALNMMPPF